jgi:hypothetical protein
MPQVHKSQYRENLGHLRKEENRMKLWVRSSDKMQLAEINNLSFKELIRGRWNIYGNYGAVSLGSYPTRERCLEIIDEIQKLLYCDFATVNSNTTIKDLEEIIKRKGSILHFPKEPLVEYHSASTVVYEMPEE